VTLVLLVLAASSHSAALSGAVLTADRPEVGELVLDSGDSCTGTLIGATTVLTTSHCASTASSFVIGAQSKRVRSVRLHPLAGRPTYSDADLAVLELESAFSGVTPFTLRSRTPTAPAVVELFGFGQDELGARHQKRRATANIAIVTGGTFSLDAFGSSACGGDSGGPAFTTDGALLGIISASNTECGGPTRLVTISMFLTWIAGAVDAMPSAGIVRPGDEATMPVTFTMNAHVSDDVGVVLHEWLVDGVVVQEAATIGTEQTADLELSPGEHVVEFGAYDGLGQRAAVQRKLTIERSVVPPRASGAACWDDTDCAATPCLHQRCSPADGCSAVGAVPLLLLAALALRRARQISDSTRSTSAASR
jgi:hypothetical protein